MRWSTVFVGLILALMTGTPSGAQSVSDWGSSPSLSVGGMIGYQRGMSFQLVGVARDFAMGLPVQARLRLGRTGVEAGSAADARRVFINNATNGTPKEKAHTWDFGLDGLYPLGDRTSAFAGIRHSRFKANFKYVGGNEDFDITSNHWGLAMGIEASYPMGPKTSLVFSGGAEYFFSSRLTGHDTSYSPDGDHVNPREDYDYGDADDAVGQPTLRPMALVGVSYRLGR